MTRFRLLYLHTAEQSLNTAKSKPRKVQGVNVLLGVIQPSDMRDKTKNMEADKETEALRPTDRVLWNFPISSFDFLSLNSKGGLLFKIMLVGFFLGWVGGVIQFLTTTETRMFVVLTLLSQEQSEPAAHFNPDNSSPCRMNLPKQTDSQEGRGRQTFGVVGHDCF